MRQNITLPALQLAAAAFFATGVKADTAQAEAQTDVFCVDQTSTVVEDAQCDAAGAAGNFFWVQGPADAEEGDFIQPISARNVEGHVSGGFGKRFCVNGC
ncbi:hypothetical protein F4776DRAFT_179809 [Hypoxylon sp. NC0597]|nr:hypothetical protein F4776DRAFT_179809 [Hypoxylon sp. NC0597]